SEYANKNTGANQKNICPRKNIAGDARKKVRLCAVIPAVLGICTKANFFPGVPGDVFPRADIFLIGPSIFVSIFRLLFTSFLTFDESRLHSEG
ncbi:MAG: hypothetical protein WA821_15095, partial [Anaerolineales bacterium]